MSQILEEQLSAVLDGELPPEELDLILARLDRDPAQRARLGRFAMIGECLRTGSGRPEALLVAERVRSALATGAAAGAPAAPAVATLRRGLLVAGVAAALAVVLLAGPGPWRADEQRIARSEVPVTGPRNDEIGLVSAGMSRRLDPRSAARLTGYLVAHGEYAHQLSRSTLDSHLVTARAERAAWRQVQDPGDAR